MLGSSGLPLLVKSISTRGEKAGPHRVDLPWLDSERTPRTDQHNGPAAGTDLERADLTRTVTASMRPDLCSDLHL